MSKKQNLLSTLAVMEVAHNRIQRLTTGSKSEMHTSCD